MPTLTNNRISMDERLKYGTISSTKNSLQSTNQYRNFMAQKATNKIICEDALTALKKVSSNSIALAVTSPPYWNLVDYGMKGQLGQGSYDQYIDDLLDVWFETDRVLEPNGKLAIITPIIPIEKRVINNQHTRHLKNIANDIEFSILNGHGKRSFTNLLRYSLFIWQKQTTTKMFGSYPFPPNIYEDNTIEFINVYVKPGTPKKVQKQIKEQSRLSQKEWLNLTMQVWPIMPDDIQRKAGHPAPFPIEIPQRLIAMYTFAKATKLGFEGDVVLDMFAGSGTTCVAAKQMGRQYLGIELNKKYCELAEFRLNPTRFGRPDLLVERVKMRSKLEASSEQLSLLGAFVSTNFTIFSRYKLFS